MTEESKERKALRQAVDAMKTAKLHTIGRYVADVDRQLEKAITEAEKALGEKHDG